MKRLWFAVGLPLVLSLLCAACHGRGNKSQSDLNSTELFETTEITTIETSPSHPDDDNGDPSIIPASVDTMLMVVNNHGELIGRYVQTNPTSFTISVQDDVEIPRLGHKVVVYRAKDGFGVVYTWRTNVNVRKEPTLESPVVTQITYVDGKLPVTYPCLGKTKGWFKIEANGKIGFVRHDLVEWDGMDTF